MNSFTRIQLKYLELVGRARNIPFDENRIVKEDKQKQADKRKIFNVAHRCMHDNEIIEASLILLKKSSIIRIAAFFILKYYIKEMLKANKNAETAISETENNDDDELF